MPVRPLLWVVGVLCLAVSLAPAFAEDNQPSDPLVRVLTSKGILTQAEADSIGSVAPADQRSKLAQILLDKGLISTAEYESVSAAAPASENNGEIRLQSTSLVTTDPGQAAPSAPKAPPVIPAAAPIRVLQLEPAKPGGMVPDIKLGSGAKLKLYGFMKASAQYDTSQPTGNDAPLPLFGISAADTGPDANPEFHLKARASRFGANFEWPDIREGTSITGRLEADWEGNFTRAFNRNISTIRSNQFNLRLAWARIDHMFSDSTSGFALFGQDWTPFGSSILPNSLETTLLGVGYGSIYERAMQIRVGFLHSFAGTSFKVGPEFAIVYPAFGDTPPFISPQSVTVPAIPTCTVLPCAAIPATVISVTTPPGNLGDQLSFGERQGADSARPEVQGRLVFQFQLDHAKGVAPAQIILSGMQGARTAILTASQIPSCTAPATSVFASNGLTPLCGNGAGGANPNLYKAAFPTGIKVDTSRNGWTGGFQLPTRFVTFVANYYRGTDLRFYFAGQLLKEFNDFAAVPGQTATGPAGTVNTVGCASGYNCGFSVDGASVINFATIDPGASGTANTIPTPVFIPQNVIRSQGGFAELSFPLSRIFGADPTGRNAGWSLNLHYGLDSVFARDARKISSAQPRQSSWGFANLQYKLNQFVTFGYEIGHYQTIDVGKATWEGISQHVAHDLHNEFATIFTF